MLGVEVAEPQEQQAEAKNVRTRLDNLESENEAKAKELRTLKAQVQRSCVSAETNIRACVIDNDQAD